MGARIACGCIVVFICAGMTGAAMHEFPSFDSTVDATVGPIDSDEIGWFWSESLGHGISETFTDPEPYVLRAVLDVDVPRNTLVSESIVWELWINDQAVGQFDIQAGFVGRVVADLEFAPVLAEDDAYTVQLRVRGDVPFDGGAHTFAFAGPGHHSITLIPEPTTLGLILPAFFVLRHARRSR